MDGSKVKKRHLPYPTGPYATGCMELMTEYSLEGCLARISYPTIIPSDQLNEYSDQWIPWIPNDVYNRSFASIIGMPYFIRKYGLALVNQTNYFIPTISNAPLSDKEQSYPLVIFSHGFGANRFICSDFCNTLASYGFIIAAIEHRDNSATTTFYYDSPEDAKNDKLTWIQHQPLLKRYPIDHYTIRNNQMKTRYKECTKLLDTILKINEGSPIENVFKSSTFDLNQFKNKIDTKNIISSGFSFGGATAMYCAGHDTRYCASLILDGWMFPLKSEPLMKIDHPVLFINSHTFNIPPNLNVLRKYIESDGNRRVVTLKKTTHESFTDTAFIHGYWLDVLMLKKMNPETALNLLSSVAVKYLGDTIGYPKKCDKADTIINEHNADIVEDVISYTKKPRRYFNLIPWL